MTSVQLDHWERKERPGEKAGRDGTVEKEVEDLGRDLSCAWGEDVADLKNQKEEHDAEVAELKRKLSRLCGGGSVGGVDAKKYVEKAFDVAIEH
ncbi:putative centrosomal protein [Sesbania bispinosa]|nr:putative centrosomal protein [Sesbania bispinosa]